MSWEQKQTCLTNVLSVNVTGYIIVNSDFSLAVINPPASVPAARELVGEVTSKGVELDIANKIHSRFFIDCEGIVIMIHVTPNQMVQIVR